jgi:acyl-CoA reductase-like NAD-dependent aldehyde dehydrogenase
MSANLDAGTVWVNDYLTFVAEYPHGGVKRSGFGSDLSSDSLREFTVAKHVVVSQE